MKQHGGDCGVCLWLKKKDGNLSVLWCHSYLVWLLFGDFIPTYSFIFLAGLFSNLLGNVGCAQNPCCSDAHNHARYVPTIMLEVIPQATRKTYYRFPLVLLTVNV